MKWQFLKSCLVLVMISMLLCAFSPFSGAVATQSVEDLAHLVVFHFSVVDYQYSITVENYSDLDVVSFRVYDCQRMDEVEKIGTSDYRHYPISISDTCAVPAGKSEVFVPSPKVMWQDCNNIVCYVYYIAFSDGSEWGTQFPVVSELPDWALRFDVPFEFSSVPQTDVVELQTSKRSSIFLYIFIGGFLVSLFVGITVLIISQKKGKKRFYYSIDGQRYTYRNPVGELSSYEKGKIGEFFSYEMLNQVPGEKRLLHNVYLRKPDGKTTEIDCLLIHQNGLFVIESKNLKGQICDSPNDMDWTQVLGKNKRIPFYNPVRQNDGHIKHLKDALSYPTNDRYRYAPVYSIIAFGPQADISTVNQEGLSSNTKVIHIDQLIETICSLTDLQNVQLSTEDITRIYEVLLPLTDVTDAEKQKHIDDIRSFT